MLTKKINLKRGDRIKVSSLRNRLTQCYNIENGKSYILAFKTTGYKKDYLVESIKGYKQVLERVFPNCTFICVPEEQLSTIKETDNIE